MKLDSCLSIYEASLDICVLFAYFKVNNNHIPKNLRQVNRSIDRILNDDQHSSSQFLGQSVDLTDLSREHAEDALYKLLLHEIQHGQSSRAYSVFEKAMVNTIQSSLII
jgi:hypothetical protein